MPKLLSLYLCPSSSSSFSPSFLSTPPPLPPLLLLREPLYLICASSSSSFQTLKYHLVRLLGHSHLGWTHSVYAKIIYKQIRQLKSPKFLNIIVAHAITPTHIKITFSYLFALLCAATICWCCILWRYSCRRLLCIVIDEAG